MKINKYEISNLGRVKSLERHGRREVLILCPTESCNGYLTVGLRHGHKVKRIAIHRLVAKASVLGNGKTVNHINGIKAHNWATNLEWCSYTENHLHAVSIGLNSSAIRVCHPDTNVIYDSINQAKKACGIDSKKIRTSWKRA